MQPHPTVTLSVSITLVTLSVSITLGHIECDVG